MTDDWEMGMNYSQARVVQGGPPGLRHELALLFHVQTWSDRPLLACGLQGRRHNFSSVLVVQMKKLGHR